MAATSSIGLRMDGLELLGRAVRETRRERGLTQQQLADLCGLHRTFVIAIEKGRQNASAATIIRLAIALGVVPGDLFRHFTRQTMKSLS